MNGLQSVYHTKHSNQLDLVMIILDLSTMIHHEFLLSRQRVMYRSYLSDRLQVLK